jgi:hypothetical protein
MNEVIRQVWRNRLPAEVASESVRTGNQYRIDGRLGECKPFHQVVVHSLERTMCRSAGAEAFGRGVQAAGIGNVNGRPDARLLT